MTPIPSAASSPMMACTSAFEPTRGVDVGSKAEVHAIIGELAAQGIGVIVISSDLPEVLALSDRVLIMREGRQMAMLDRAEADQETVMTAAMGQKRLERSLGLTP